MAGHGTCRGVALVSLERLSRDGPAPVNSARALLHELVTHDPNEAVRRLAALCLKNGSPQRDTILILESLGRDDEQARDLRQSAAKVADLGHTVINAHHGVREYTSASPAPAARPTPVGPALLYSSGAGAATGCAIRSTTTTPSIAAT